MVRSICFMICCTENSPVSSPAALLIIFHGSVIIGPYMGASVLILLP
jgi:hypothetical protein